jgi:hypothetical protein
MKYQSFSEFKKAKEEELSKYFIDNSKVGEVDLFLLRQIGSFLEASLLEAAQAGIEAGKMENKENISITTAALANILHTFEQNIELFQKQSEIVGYNSALLESEKQSYDWLNK